MAICFKLAQDGTSRGSSDIGHISEIFVIDVDFDRAGALANGATTIPNAEQNRNKALNVVAYHQVVGPTHRHIEMSDRYESKEAPRRGV